MCVYVFGTVNKQFSIARWKMGDKSLHTPGWIVKNIGEEESVFNVPKAYS